MNAIAAQIALLKRWDPADSIGPFQLVCELSEQAASVDEVDRLHIDDGLRAFWLCARSAKLFKDVKYGQWGLQLLSPPAATAETKACLSERPNDFADGDLVIGCFIGDSDLLIMTAVNGVYEIRVAFPLDPRTDWPLVANSFAEFLEAYVAAKGEKYWENSLFSLDP